MTIGEKLFWYILFALVAVFTHLSYADDRFTQIESAWNSGNTLDAQQHFSPTAAHAQARFAAEAEEGGKLQILELKRLSPDYFGVNAEVCSEVSCVRTIWVFQECDGMFCWWGDRKNWAAKRLIGGLERSAAYDAGTTAAGLAMGAAEANPLGLVGGGIVKGAIAVGSRNVPYDECVQMRGAGDAVWTGVSVANIATLLGSPFAGAVMAGLTTAYLRSDKAYDVALFDCAEYQFNNQKQEVNNGLAGNH